MLARIAQITEIATSPNGYRVTIGYRPYDQPGRPMALIDGLDLAEQSERDWREFLTAHGISPYRHDSAACPPMLFTRSHDGDRGKPPGGMHSNLSLIHI